jgi:hypothetical protein
MKYKRVLVSVLNSLHVRLVVVELHARGELPQGQQLGPQGSNVQSLDQPNGKDVLVAASDVQQVERGEHRPGEVLGARVCDKIVEARVREERGVAKTALSVVA